MVDRHYSLNLKQWSARTLYVYTHVNLAQIYSVGLQEIFVSRLCSQEENSFFLHCFRLYSFQQAIGLIDYCLLPSGLVSMLTYFSMSGADKDYIPMFSWTNLFLAVVLRLNNKVIFNPTKHKT
jgi:hypothetical protein